MDLFGRARRLLGGDPGAAEERSPQYFHVHCVEGHSIRGRRTEGYQALRCPECGQGVFVLPRSPLPEPPGPRTRNRRDLPTARSLNEDDLVSLQDPGWQTTPPHSDEEEIRWVDAPTEPQLQPPARTAVANFDPDLALEGDSEDKPSLSLDRSLKPDQRKAAPSNDRPPRRPGKDRRTRQPTLDEIPELSSAAPGQADPLILVQERQSAGAWLQRNQSRLVFAAVGLLVLGTVLWSIHRQSRRDYPRLALLGRTVGIEALEAGQFDKAHQILAEADRAVQALRGEVAGASEIVQAAREAAIYVDLLPVPCEDLLDLRVRAPDEDSWQRDFQRQFKGRSILVQGRVVKGPGGDLGRYDLDYRILVPGPTSPRIARLCLDDLELIQSIAPRPGDILQLGARLSGVEADLAGDGWLFRLEPQSGVIMSHQGALKALGWEPTP